MKVKKSELDDINKMFQSEVLNCVRKLNALIADFIEDKLETEKLFMVINSEKKCDRLKERYIQILYEQKRSLPFLVEDRYRIIKSLDKVSNKSEFVARFLEVCPFKILPEIKEGFKSLNDFYLQTAEKLIECTMLMETDFDGAYKLTFEIEALKRNAHNLKFILLNILFKQVDNPLRVNLMWKLIAEIFGVISWAEELSDYLRGLILKYPTK